MTGWNLPPGCNVRDIPGNRPEDQTCEECVHAEECDSLYPDCQFDPEDEGDEISLSEAESTRKVRWIGEPKTHCDMCGAELTDSFIDGKTAMGPWAIMCRSCHRSVGKGFGLGLGQLFRRNNIGEWIKVAG